MSDPKDGPWDDATAHDDAVAQETAHMDGDDPPTTRATLAQQVRMRAVSRSPSAAMSNTVSRQGGASTLPPPVTPERLPAAAVHDAHDAITPVALPTVTEAALRRSREEGVRPASPTAVGTGLSSVGDRVVLVALGSDAEHMRKLCQSKGLSIPILSSLDAVHPASAAIVLGEPALPIPPRITYVARTALDDDAVADLVRALVSERVVIDPPPAPADVDPRSTQLAADIASLGRDLVAIEKITSQVVAALVQADRTYVRFFADKPPAAGIVTWCAYTGRAAHASPASDDPRYLFELDDPDGKPQSRIVVQPVVGADRRTHAVLVAARRWRHSDFTATERTALAQLAATIAAPIEAAATGKPPIVAAPTVAPRPPAPATPPVPAPVVTEARSGPVVPVEPVAPPGTTSQPPSPARAKSTSDAPPTRSKRRTGEADLIDVAVVATAADDIARVRKITRKMRLEVSVLPGADEVPAYYRIVTLGEAWTSDSDPRVAYAARSSIMEEQLSDLLVGLSHDRAPNALLISDAPHSAPEAKRVQQAIAAARVLAAATDLADAETRAIDSLKTLLDADRAYVLYYARDTGALWSETRRRTHGDDRRAIAGVAGWAARSGRAANVPRAGADPRWLGPLDDPDGDMHSQLIVQPMIAPDRRVLGVLVAVRRTKRPPFSDMDVVALARFAALASPVVEQLQLVEATQAFVEKTGGAVEEDARAVETPVERMLRLASTAPRWAYAAGGAGLMLVLTQLIGC